MCHLVATVLKIFLRINEPNYNFIGGLARGPPGARGPRFIEPPEPPVATPLITLWDAIQLIFA